MYKNNNNIGFIAINLQLQVRRMRRRAAKHTFKFAKRDSVLQSIKLYVNGYTLIEIMLVLLLSSILFAGLIQVYLSVKKIYQTQNEIANLQENISFAAYFLKRNISKAGFAGCNKLENLNFTDSANAGFTASNVIRGFTDTNVPTYLKNKIAPNTDVIIIQKADLDATKVLEPLPKKGATVFHVYENPANKNNKLLLLSDCKNADLFLAKNYEGNDIKLAVGTINHDYQEQFADVMRYTEIAYFIDKDKHALYMIRNAGNKEELVEGISSMKILYGLDKYLSAAEIDQQNLWSKVKSVKITLSQNSNLIKMQSLDVIVNLEERQN